MLINLGWHANRSQISCSQCYDSIFTLNQQKMNFEYRNRFFISLFVFRHLDSDLFQVSMHLNLVMHAYRSQISCSQCYYNLIFTLNQRKKITLNIKIDFLYCFSFFDIRTLTFFQVIMLIYLGETSPFYLLILDVINWFIFGHELHIYFICEPGCEKTGLRGFLVITGLYNNRRWLEA